MKLFLNILYLVVFSAIVAGSTVGIEYTAPVAFVSSILSVMIYSATPNGVLYDIPLTDARNLYSKTLARVYREDVSAGKFLMSFFPANMNFTRYVSIEVERDNEIAATDIVRGTEGNYNKAEKFTEHIYEPPMYWEYFAVNEMRLYDTVIGAGSESKQLWSQLINESNRKLMKMQKKIERSFEIQCASVLETGAVTLINNDTINYNRKSASMVDYSGTPWTNNANNPITHLTVGCEFLRSEGKSEGEWYDGIFGGSALNAMQNNTLFQSLADIKDFQFHALNAPQRNSAGGSLHGYISVGSYKVRVWTYTGMYKNSAGVMTKFINDKNVVLLPEKPNFSFEFGIVPQLIQPGGTIPQTGPFLVQEFLNDEAAIHKVNLKTCGLAVPTAIDQMWTAQVVA